MSTIAMRATPYEAIWRPVQSSAFDRNDSRSRDIRFPTAIYPLAYPPQNTMHDKDALLGEPCLRHFASCAIRSVGNQR